MSLTQNEQIERWVQERLASFGLDDPAIAVSLLESQNPTHIQDYLFVSRSPRDPIPSACFSMFTQLSGGVGERQTECATVCAEVFREAEILHGSETSGGDHHLIFLTFPSSIFVSRCHELPNILYEFLIDARRRDHPSKKRRRGWAGVLVRGSR